MSARRAALLLLSSVVVIVGGAGSAGADEPPIRSVTVAATPTGAFPVPRVLGGLADGAVVEVRAVGFPANADGVAAQCAIVATTCGRAFPLRFDGQGNAVSAVVLDEELGPRGCATEPCALRVRSGTTGGTTDLVFGSPAVQPGHVQAHPDRGLAGGDLVTVSLTDFPPGTLVRVAQCAPPGDPARCGDVRAVTIDAEGTATVEVAVETGRIGAAPDSVCRRDEPCGMSVVSLAPGVTAPVAVILFEGRPPATYDPTRLAAGVAAAAVLVLLAIWVLRTTDWSRPGAEPWPPAGADGPEPDGAV